MMVAGDILVAGQLPMAPASGERRVIRVRQRLEPPAITERTGSSEARRCSIVAPRARVAFMERWTSVPDLKAPRG